MKNTLLKFALLTMMLPLLSLAGCKKDSTDDKPQGPAPVLTVKLNDTNTLNVSAAGGQITLLYEVANPVEGKTVSVSSKESWIHDFDVTTAGKVLFAIDEYTEESEPRTGTIVFSYPDAADVTVTVVQAVPVKPIRLEITNVSLRAAAVEGKADDPSLTFLFGVVKKSDYDALGSSEKFIEQELAEQEALAKEWDMTLPEYLDFMFSMWEDEPVHRASYTTLDIDTEYYAYAYGVNTKAEVTTRLVLEPFRTEALKTISFNLSTADVAQTTATLKAAPDTNDTYYYLGYIQKEEYENSFQSNDQEVINNVLGIIRMSIGNDGSKLDELSNVFKGAGSLPISGLLPGTEYYAVAFGIDMYVSECTVLSKVPFTTEEVTVTDDCTFDIKIMDINSILIDMDVRPSKSTTRYFATIRATKDTQNMTPEQVADDEIAFQNGFMPPIDWKSDPRIFTGERSLNSRIDLGITILKPETDYTIYVFGVSEAGVRTTRVKALNVKTTAVVPSSMRMEIKDVTAGSETDPNDWFGNQIYFFTYGVTPTINDEYYYTGAVKKSDYDAFGGDDKAFMAQVIAEAGEYIMMNCFMGENNGTLMENPTLFKLTYDYKGADIASGEEYYLFAFGYMGGDQATTDLFKVSVKSAGESSGGGWPPSWSSER